MANESNESNGSNSFLSSLGGLLPGVLGGIAGIFGASADRKAQRRANEQQRKFALDMYNRQKADALDFWNQQNAYNTPAAQMQRFKDAGLNPNLIYGRGSEGNAGAINVPSQGHFNPKAPEFGGALAQAGLGLGSSISRYYDLRAKGATINNLGAQNDVLKADARLKEAQRLVSLVGAARGSFDLGLRKAAKGSLELALKSQGPRANAMANISVAQAYNEQRRGKLLDQSYAFLSQMNPRQLDAISETVQRSRERGKLNAAELTRRIKENRLIGISSSTEIGSLVRALLTIFGQDSQLFGK